MELNDKIYVAGHRGLVGSAIVRALRLKGYTRVVGRTHEELDLLDPVAVENFFDQEKPDYVFLAAAHVGGIMANNTCRADFIYRNLGIQQHVIGASFRHKVKKLLFLGSTCIYPKEAPQPMKEDVLLTSPLEYTNEPYAIAKIAGLKMCESFNLQYGTNYLAVMPTNLYGPNDNFDLISAHVLPAMIRKMWLADLLMRKDYDAIRRDITRRPLPDLAPSSPASVMEAALSRYGIFPDRLELWGSGRPLREFLWSEEMAEACVYVMEHVDFSDLCKSDKGEIRNCHINIGTGKEVSISDLASLVAQAVGYHGQILFDSSRPDGCMRKLTDPSLIQSLGWHHNIELQQGVPMLYDWYKTSIGL
ncbi:GDP-L-fucose synthase family protein [Porphyromonas crevioricanis]|uniref:GDP-L-fucose synthase n=1 Tax=Porphyromonas crevioricanis TaxID=393921 RepID=A0AB34PEV1_9PORP|nr:GDP-L-fucose synthase [Porphyromonas crevioricanis]KGN93877.1 GDP-4-keto-6-deoxy-D-mannose-3, 5-epimerase-4-reductase [Porphyromonas crevioricanis]